jgi:hypothetical protein
VDRRAPALFPPAEQLPWKRNRRRSEQMEEEEERGGRWEGEDGERMEEEEEG